MRLYKLTLPLIGFICLLAGCDQQAMFEKFIPQEEAAIAKQVLSRLAAKDYASIEKQLDSKLQTSTVRGALEQMASMFPGEEPRSVATVGSNTSTVNGITTYKLTLEHQYTGIWLLSNVVFQRRDGSVVLLGLHVNPMKQSLKALNRFTFDGKGPLHYLVFTLAIAIPLFILYALVLCFKTPIKKRKWLWLLFVAMGFVQFSLNWTDGSYGVQPISFALLGAGFFQTGPYAPLIFNIAIPLGAIVFLVKRRSLVGQSAG